MLGSSWRARARLGASVVGVAVAVASVTVSAAAAGLPDGRGYELVSPSDKHGVDIVADSSRTRAAASEAPGLPAAVAFTAIGGFADVQGTGISTDYMAQRNAVPGTSGWATHAITPPQAPLTFYSIVNFGEPSYQGEMSNDLTAGVVKGLSPLTDAPNVAHVLNLYERNDLRSPGFGSYQLLSDAALPLSPLVQGQDAREFVTGASDDFKHVTFETKQDLTSDANGTNVKLYKTDNGVTRLLAPGPGCPGFTGPCSAAGRGMSTLHYTPRMLSSDGSRATFTSPVIGGGGGSSGDGGILSSSGAASKVFQLDDRGTSTTADDALIQINASEASAPGPTTAATYETASADGNRVFFISGEQLTDAPGAGLYVWERQPTNEVQSVTVDATGGTFTLTAHSQPSAGSGTLANGSTTISNVQGSFSVGQTITAPDIPRGTTVVDVPTNTSLTLSAPATADGDESLRGSVDATTAPLAHDATAAQVQSALEALSDVGSGNVSVSGGPGDAGGTRPYFVTFTGALAGVDVAQLTADGTALSGDASTATPAVTVPVHNLTRIAETSTNTSVAGVIGASRDGHRLYFATQGAQLVPGGPHVNGSGIYYWQDADNTPGGTLSFVGAVLTGDTAASTSYVLWVTTPQVARVTPDGRHLAFEVTDGSALAPGIDQSACRRTADSNPNNVSGGGCSEVYVYSADGSSPTAPDLLCASCPAGGGSPAASALINFRKVASIIDPTTHLSHALSDDGRRVFFSTPDALVPEDTNSKIDAYEYDVPSGTVHLISSGTDAFDSYFLDASADGHDVYFVTRERLVGWDTDNAYDMYDARIDGGFPDPPAPPAQCAGDACQGGAPAPPAATAVGSAVFRGAGDARSRLRSRPQAKRCKRGQVKRRVRGRVRCVRRTHRRHVARRAETKRRAK